MTELLDKLEALADEIEATLKEFQKQIEERND